MTLSPTLAAAERVMDRMDLSVESSALEGLLVARTTTDERVRVSASSDEDGRITVTVPVGLACSTAAGRSSR